MEFERNVQRALELLMTNQGQCERAVIAREMATSKSNLDRIEATLQDRALIHVEVSAGSRLWRRVT